MSIIIESESVLVYSTSEGYIRGIDLRAKKTIWEFPNQKHLGNYFSILSILYFLFIFIQWSYFFSSLF